MDAAGREMQVRTFVEEVWNNENYQAVSDLYAENCASPFGTGPAAEPIRRYHQAFPDLRIGIEELIVAGDTVVLRAAFRGTDTGGYAGRAATGGRWTSGWSPSCTSTVTGSSGSGPAPTSSACSSSSASWTTRGPARTPLKKPNRVALTAVVHHSIK
jgi:hypothetical protein